MEIIAVDAFSSSQLLVIGALALFATIILSSIYIRIHGQYRGRNKLPDHTRKKVVFGRRRSRDAHLPSMSPENPEVVSGARPKAPVKDEVDGFRFDFEVPEQPRGPIEHVAREQQQEDLPPDSLWDVPVEAGDAEFAEASANGAEGYEYEDRVESEIANVPETSHEHSNEAPIEGNDENTEYGLTDNEMAIGWDANGEDAFNDDGEEDQDGAIDASENSVMSEFVEEEYQENGQEFHEDDVSLASEQDFLSANEYQEEVDDDQDENAYADHEVEGSFESEADDVVVPFDTRTAEVKRVEIPSYETNHSFAVVSVCLISDDDGQIYRDIRGEYLGAFLNKRGFIYLDEEYHLQNKSTVDKGAIRVRNYEATSIGSLVKGNEETCGFRLYFRPADCADPLATLNEMLKIANLSIGFFSDVCAKPLVIYDGRKDSTGDILPLTQEDYDSLKRDLHAAFPRSLAIASKRTVLSRNDYAPSEDLPTRAETF